MNNYHKNDENTTNEVRNKLLAVLPALEDLPAILGLKQSRNKNRWQCSHHQDSEHTDHIQIRSDGTWYCHGCNTGGLDSVSLALHYMTWKQLIDSCLTGKASISVTAHTIRTRPQLPAYPMPAVHLLALWEDINKVKWTDSRFDGYFSNRLICPDVAHNEGLRPLNTATEVLKKASDEVKEYLGLHAAFYGEYGDGILIPCFVPGTNYPVAYRVRIYDSEIKESAGKTPVREGYASPVRPPIRWRKTAGITHTILITEGLPDYLTALTLCPDKTLVIGTIDGNLKINLPVMNLVHVKAILDLTHQKSDEQSRKRNIEFQRWITAEKLPAVRHFNLQESADLNDLTRQHGIDTMRTELHNLMEMGK